MNQSDNFKRVSNVLQYKGLSESNEIVIYKTHDTYIAGRLLETNARANGMSDNVEWLFIFEHLLGESVYDFAWGNVMLNEKNVRHLRLPTEDEKEKVIWMKIN